MNSMQLFLILVTPSALALLLMGAILTRNVITGK